MASVRNVDMRNYCDSMFDELTDVKSRILDLVACIDEMPAPQREMLKSHVGHLRDIANTIDWKLEILTKVCPADWTRYSPAAESGSVKVPESFETDLAGGGNVGG